MDKYRIVMRPEVYRKLDLIYSNICYRATDASIAEQVIIEIEKGILSLQELPYRGAELKSGLYARQGYRKIMIKKHLVIYTVREAEKEIVVLFIKYMSSDR